MADDEADVQYCVCQQVDSGIMIECIRGTGGCNSWVHPACCGLILTQEELEAIDSYICPLCESPSDDFTKMKALNTRLANRLAKKERKRKLLAASGSASSASSTGSKEKTKAKGKDTSGEKKSSSSSSSSSKKTSSSTKTSESGGASATNESESLPTKPKRKWTCKQCAHENMDREATECEACHLPRKSSKSSSSKKKTSSSSASLSKEKKKKQKLDAEDGDDTDRRRSHRESNKKKKSYHVPNSDEDLSSAGESGDESHKKKKHRGKKRRRDDDGDNNAGMGSGSESDEAEFQIDFNTKKKSKQDSSAFAAAAPSMVIEKIMGVRKREVVESAPTGPSPDSAVASIFAPRTITTVITEYYIKWKGFSYLHCSWESLEVLLEIDAFNNKQRIKRFHEKEHHHHHHKPFEEGDEESEREYFNPEYLEVHRILADRKETPIPADPLLPDAPVDDGVRYLVKWRILPYTDATWERACDLKDDVAIEKYKKFQVVPPKESWEPLPRPTLREYRKLDESPLFGEDQTLKLRAYQLEGLNWLIWNWYNERPSILADEMGLGKTIQTLAFLDRLRFSENIMSRGPFLIVAPLSLIAQWQNECETWTTMNCIVYHGNGDAREIIREYEFYYPDSHNKPDKKKPFKFNILVTTYEVAIKDISILAKIKWRCLVVDEAHRLKNQASRLVEQMRSLRRDHCVLLTGTPLQNKTEELWALLNFLDGKSFPSVHDFLEKFGDLHEAQQVADLHKMLKPYLLRRVKEDVEKSLPPKEETIIEVELTPVQKQWYRAIYEKNTTFLNRGGNPHNVPNLMNVMMELRKCCNHPYLNNGVEDILSEGLITDAQRHEMMVKCCGKMVLLDKLLPRLKDGGHKVLIFSQMVRVLDIIEDYVRYMGYLHERLDGNIRGNDRQAAVDRFVKPEYSRFVMLLSTKAGGLGLNLTAADTVIIFDSDWNPQNDLQAQARAHRIGQTHSVKIYRLITRKTYEMHMFHKASLKLGLDKAVLTHMRRENEEVKDGKKKTSKAEESKEIDELLKRGAYDVFRDDDTAAEQFCAADIDQILQRSTQVVQYEQQAKSSFSKASFVSATTSDDIDIDDPDFWKKAVGLTEPDPSELADDVPLQRKRTRVSRFGTSGMFDSDGEEEDELDKKEKEAERKEKEREKEERERAEEKKEPRDWTLNGRDRLQRALMHFGPGRWEIIRSQSGGSRTVEEVEQFAREFIYVLGLSSVESLTSTSKDDSVFIKSVVRASLYAQKESLVDEEEIAPVLKDEEFVLKLKQGGARRVLIRLDMLVRLQRLVGAACDKLDAEYYAQHDQQMTEGEAVPEGGNEAEPVGKPKPPPSPVTADLDERVAYYGVPKVIATLDLVDISERPSWTQITPWWDQEADRHLLMGVFLHGYGRCAQILGDSRLRFAKLEKEAEEAEAKEDKKIGASADEKQSVDGNSRETNGKEATADNALSSESKAVAEKKEKSEDVTMSNGESDDDDNSTVNGDDGDDADTKSQSGSSSNGNAAKETSAVKKEDDSGEGEASGSSGAASSSDRKFKQPEVQQMNRLLFWLLSADDIKRQKELEVFKKERAGIEQQRQAALERKQRLSALRRVEMKAVQLGQLDVLRQMTVIKNANEMPDAIIGQKIKPRDWTKEERRTFSYLIGLYGAPRIQAKSSVSAAAAAIGSASSSGADGLIRPFAWQTDSISWTNIVKWGKLNKTAELARQFYEQKFLPKCIEVANMKADPLAADQRAVALADLIGIEFIDAHEGVLAHGLKAKHHAWVTLRRSQLLNDVLNTMSNRQSELIAYLRSGSEELVRDMPVWWCPWIHDLAVFDGMARYGVANWEKILLDRKLPFHREARSQHIRLVFLEGSANFAPLYRHMFDSETSMSAWFDQVVEEFPSLAVLERKVQRICEEALRSEDRSFRYEEDDYRRAFSFPVPHNCLEESIMKAVRCRDAPVDRSVVAPRIGSSESGAFRSSEALAGFMAESQSRRDEYLRRAIAASPVGERIAELSSAVAAHSESQPSSKSPTPTNAAEASSSATTSQIPIQMLVS